MKRTGKEELVGHRFIADVSSLIRGMVEEALGGSQHHSVADLSQFSPP
jgi:hypothetical protein